MALPLLHPPRPSKHRSEEGEGGGRTQELECWGPGRVLERGSVREAKYGAR